MIAWKGVKARRPHALRCSRYPRRSQSRRTVRQSTEPRPSGESFHAIGSFSDVANLGRIIDTREKRMDAAGAPGHDGKSLAFLPGVFWLQAGLRKLTRDPSVNCDILGQRATINNEQRHFMLWVDFQIFRRQLLTFCEVDASNLKISPGFRKVDIWNHRASYWRVV